MDISHGQPFWVGILAFGLLSAVALADPAQDTAHAEEAFRVGDLVKAMALLKQAAEQNYPPAQARLAELLDVAEQNEEAVRWFRKAADQGSAAGEFGLGRMYAAGEGVEKDAGKAVFWIRRAAEKDYLPAVDVMAQAYRIGDLGLAIDIQQSQFWETRSQTLKKDTAAGKTMEKSEQGQGK
ncbi:MAG: sel1 repeat family protein [Candidatus Thermoplasmatota archaeon]|nr:sel1 repeat family protein [Candidatus Thermoplasmatota archaeon]